MLTNDFALGRDHIAIIRGQVFLQKFAKRALADKADAGAVFFGGGGQARFGGQAAHFGLFQIAQRENSALELMRLQAVEEIALVFVLIQAFEQIMHAAAHFFARIMAGGNHIGALCDGIIEKAFELDFGIAEHIGIGRAPGLVFLQKIGENFVFILRGKIHNINVDADNVGHGHGIERIFFDAAIFVVVVVFPILHKHAVHMMAGLFEQISGYRRIYAAGQADNDIFGGGSSVHGAADEGGCAALKGRLRKRMFNMCLQSGVKREAV